MILFSTLKKLKMKPFYLAFFIFINFACNATKKFETAGMTNKINPNAAKQKIYKSKREFVFDLTITRNDTVFQVVDLDSNNYKVIKHFEAKKTDKIIKKIHLYVYPNLLADDFPLQDSQALICYLYEFEQGKYSKNKEITGVMQTDNYLFLHPPRQFLEIIEYCPFPEVPIPLKPFWETHGNIYGYNARKWGINDTTLNSYCTKKYSKIENTTFYFQHKQIPCTQISSVFLNDKNRVVSYADFLFNPTFGFMRSQFRTVGNYIITIDLKKVIQH
jgi:hypothetical protein